MKNVPPIRLYVIEDHPVVVSGLTNFFRPSRDEISVAGSSPSVEHAFTQADPSEFDLFVLDLYLPAGEPLQNFAILKKCFPDKPIVIFTVEESNLWRNRMFEVGANGYIMKNSDKMEIKIALRNAVYMNLLSQRNTRFSRPPAPYTGILDQKNKEIIRLLANGENHEVISQKTGISISMVDRRLRGLRNHFHARNNVHLCKLMLKVKLL